MPLHASTPMATPQLTAEQAQRWLPRLGPAPRPGQPPPRVRLICWPFAGGSAASFAAWPAALHPSVEVRALQLPGRGVRMAETPLQRVDAARPQVLAALAHFSDLPLVFFGHSLGALLAYDAVYHGSGLWRSQLRQLILSAKPAPHIQPRMRRQDLPDAALLDELEQFGGTPPELLAHREFMAMILPMLRADFAMVENYAQDCSPLPAPGLVADSTAFPGAGKESPGNEPASAAQTAAEVQETLAGAQAIGTPVRLWWATQDQQAAQHQVLAWRPYFTHINEEYAFDGGHFYLNEDRGPVLARVNQCLAEVLNTL